MQKFICFYSNLYIFMILFRQISKDKKDIFGVVFVVSGGLENFGEYNEYTEIIDRSDLKKFIEIFCWRISSKK